MCFLHFTGCSSMSYRTGLRQAIFSNVVQHHESRFDGVGQVSLLQQSWLPLKGPSKAVVIIVHGLKDHSDRYAAVAEKLAQNSYSVYAYDLRGHGDSEGQRVWVDQFDQYISDLEIFYDLVRQENPNQPIYLFGHSMGGAIVTTFALQQSRPVAGLILSAPALKVGEDINGFLIVMTKIFGSITPSLAVLDLKDESFSRDPAVVQALKNDSLIYHGKGPARTAKELLKAIAFIQEKKADVKVPFLALHGDRDVLTNPQGSQELYMQAASTDKTLKIYPGLYHDLLHEPEKDQVYQDILAWLNQRSSFR